MARLASVSRPLALVASRLATAPGLLLLVMACVWLVEVTALVEVAVRLLGVPRVRVRLAAMVPPPVRPSPARTDTVLCATWMSLVAMCVSIVAWEFVPTPLRSE
jgi:hypothetical protein